MATPKRKTSHARTASRKANWLGALSAPVTANCPHCGEAVVSYRACPACGHYKGREIFKPKDTATA
ncbi:MAG: 50S ribosomal protein L32 [Synergistaceae bacterium]|jgi:large subunit ribosomal protein L32|nr:50S ribosomal protein L32 [Synergistaceae bacterium]